MTLPKIPMLVYCYPNERRFTVPVAHLGDPHVQNILRIFEALYGQPISFPAVRALNDPPVPLPGVAEFGKLRRIIRFLVKNDIAAEEIAA